MLAAALTILVQLLACAFVYGRLTEKVKGNSKEIKEVKEAQKDSGAVLTRHEGEIGELFGRVGLHRG